jgi:CubicO group peptidase (beta-lactamase class C family)
MSTAGFGAPGSANNVNQPWGHSDATGQRVSNKNDNPPAIGPAGTVHASLADWADFIRLHLDGSAGSLSLNSSTLTVLHTQFPLTPESDRRYGWGWLMGDDLGGLALGHDGSNNLWYCSCHLVPGRGVAFLAVANIGGKENGKGDEACWKVIAALRDKYLASSGG